MSHVSIKEFLRTGRFGPIELGATQEQIEKFFGLPDGKGGSSRKHRDQSIWQYGDIELHFHVHLRVLFLIRADHFETLTGGGDLKLDSWFLSGKLLRKGAELYLERAQISYQLLDYPQQPDTNEIRTCGNVSLLFGGEDEASAEQRHLVAISRGGGRRQT